MCFFRKRPPPLREVPSIKSLDGFDTTFQQSITKEQLDQLSNLTWIETLHKLCFTRSAGSQQDTYSISSCFPKHDLSIFILVT